MEANNHHIDLILCDAQRESAWKEIVEAYQSKHSILKGGDLEDILESIQEYVYMRRFDKSPPDAAKVIEAMDYMARIATFLAGIIVHNRPKDLDSDYITRHVIECIFSLQMVNFSD